MRSSAYLDANALIEAVEGSDVVGLEFLRSAHERRTRFVTSELTFAEVSMKPVQDRDASLVALYEQLIFGGDMISGWPVDREILRKSAEVRAWLGGKLPDTIHVATAIVSECAVLVSSDQRMRMPRGMARLALHDFMRTDAGS